MVISNKIHVFLLLLNSNLILYNSGIGSMEEEIENHHDPKEIESTENVSVTEIIGTLNKEIEK